MVCIGENLRILAIWNMRHSLKRSSCLQQFPPILPPLPPAVPVRLVVLVLVGERDALAVAVVAPGGRRRERHVAPAAAVLLLGQGGGGAQGDKEGDEDLGLKWGGESWPTEYSTYPRL